MKRTGIRFNARDGHTPVDLDSLEIASTRLAETASALHDAAEKAKRRREELEHAHRLNRNAIEELIAAQRNLDIAQRNLDIAEGELHEVERGKVLDVVKEAGRADPSTWQLCKHDLLVQDCTRGCTFDPTSGAA